MFSYCIAVHHFQVSAMIQKFIKLSIYRLIRAYYNRRFSSNTLTQQIYLT